MKTAAQRASELRVKKDRYKPPTLLTRKGLVKHVGPLIDNWIKSVGKHGTYQSGAYGHVPDTFYYKGVWYYVHITFSVRKNQETNPAKIAKIRDKFEG